MRASFAKPLVCLALLACIVRPLAAADFVDSKVMHIEYPGWFIKDEFYDMQASLKKAGAEGKSGLMLVFGTEGCSYCAVFNERSLQNPHIASLVQKDFVSMGLEIFDDAEMTDPMGKHLPVKVFAKQQSVEYSPTLLFFDTSGQRVLRVVGYQSPERFINILEFVAERRYNKETLAQYFSRLNARKSVPAGAMLREDAMFIRPPYKLNRRKGGVPLLVLFEEPGCKECDDFHDNVLRSGDIRSKLEKFDIVRLNTADRHTQLVMPNGSTTTPASWFTQTAFTRVPALLFYNESNQEVLKTDALVQRNRMMNSVNFVLERAWKKGWTYQRFSRSKAIERSQGRGEK